MNDTYICACAQQTNVERAKCLCNDATDTPGAPCEECRRGHHLLYVASENELAHDETAHIWTLTGEVRSVCYLSLDDGETHTAMTLFIRPLSYVLTFIVDGRLEISIDDLLSLDVERVTRDHPSEPYTFHLLALSLGAVR